MWGWVYNSNICIKLLQVTTIIDTWTWRHYRRVGLMSEYKISQLGGYRRVQSSNYHHIDIPVIDTSTSLVEGRMFGRIRLGSAGTDVSYPNSRCIGANHRALRMRTVKLA